MTPKHAARRAMMLTLGFDILMALAAMSVAVVLVWSSEGPRDSFPALSLALSTLSFGMSVAASFVVMGIQKQVWRHLGWPDAVRIFQAICLAALIYLPGMLLLNGLLATPLASLMVALVLWTIGLFAGRMYALSRSTHEPFQIFSPVAKNGQPVLLVGDSQSCFHVIRRIQSSPQSSKVRLLGLVETQATEPGRAIRGIPIMGSLEELGEIIEVIAVRYKQVPWIAVTGAARNRDTMLKVLETASDHGAEIMALNRDEAAQVLEPVRPADLLSRPERHLSIEPVRNLVENANVLVTGGGGTIGSELTRQIARLQPGSLTVFDASEYNLYSIDMELAGIMPKGCHKARLGDVRDINRVRDVFSRAQPDVVIHAAALKHVPLMERNICEAILTNVAGAIHSVQAAAAVGAKRFVFISTDKAVDPDNVMGATKRLAEMAITQIAAESGMAASIVRFGNVLGSSGSVVPLFEKQIAAGGPVTLTDPNVTRYFMTVEEASALVLQAATLQDQPAHTGLFVLDMGEPMQILQLAETMIRLKGLVPGVDIKITTTGLRDGEKMHEVLTYEHEHVSKTPVDGVNRVDNCTVPSELFEKRLKEIIEAASRRERSEALRLLGVLVPEYAVERAEKARRWSA
ncbi:MAG: polysaccharide biosynthesis protein [Alphaproteobacteria bacterium]|nr:polysaccharide biosynthesis protein [Hyphomonas sp.]MBR9807955.1 polysaccharide biosynthesis protein [Alphaproteobacteria bacterium]|tara:strand:+ start:559 stop:2451 length:1893 start_codon:yes stop_codon:yes gene_type:complete